jgi:hypothetical protein
MEFQPKTQKEQVLWYLLNYKEVDQKFVINDAFFWKFNTRLSELENEHGVFTKKSFKHFTNRFGNAGKYYVYSLRDRKKALNILDYLRK